jgi:hypothetical protein
MGENLRSRMVKDDQPDLSRLFQVTVVNSIAAEGWDSTRVESLPLRLQLQLSRSRDGVRR